MAISEEITESLLKNMERNYIEKYSGQIKYVLNFMLDLNFICFFIKANENLLSGILGQT